MSELPPLPNKPHRASTTTSRSIDQSRDGDGDDNRSKRGIKVTVLPSPSSSTNASPTKVQSPNSATSTMGRRYSTKRQISSSTTRRHHHHQVRPVGSGSRSIRVRSVYSGLDGGDNTPTSTCHDQEEPPYSAFSTTSRYGSNRILTRQSPGGHRTAWQSPTDQRPDQTTTFKRSRSTDSDAPPPQDNQPPPSTPFYSLRRGSQSTTRIARHRSLGRQQSVHSVMSDLDQSFRRRDQLSCDVSKIHLPSPSTADQEGSDRTTEMVSPLTKVDTKITLYRDNLGCLIKIQLDPLADPLSAQFIPLTDKGQILLKYMRKLELANVDAIPNEMFGLSSHADRAKIGLTVVSRDRQDASNFRIQTQVNHCFNFNTDRYYLESMTVSQKGAEFYVKISSRYLHPVTTPHF